ncbi:uncharacterized protein LOC126562411 [Anopheles maculipalpis]|uniref:uncharacterized protein LOC126562411 n=1 Tax=Anopheles maculipalpis TaxID=1496333 RepID=UPI002159A1C0|nr:uncharacterized protein LOC126562411 [Anopheles maculipalpis]
MHPLQVEKLAVFRALLADTLRMVICLSQWCCTAPYPLEPYQSISSKNRPNRFRIVQPLRRVFSALLFSVVLAVPFLLYYRYSGNVHVFKIPLSVKLMFYLQALLQTGSLGYVLLVYQFRTDFHDFYFDHLVSVLVNFGHPEVDKRLHTVQTNILRVLFVIIVLVILVLSAQLIRNNSWANLLKVVIFIITKLMATSVAMQYVTLFGIVSVLLGSMNDTLETMHNGVGYSDASDPGSRSHYALAPVRLTRDDEDTIEKIRLLQLHLLQIVLRTNGGEYGRLLIVILLTTFIFLNTELLQLYQGVKAGVFTFDVLGAKLTNSALQFAMLVMHAFSNRLIQQQNLRGLKLILQLHSSANSLRCHEITNRFITQTTLFLDKAHEAYGMISVDMTLIMSVVGGLTSILVVLVQFSDAKSSCN